MTHKNSGPENVLGFLRIDQYIHLVHLLSLALNSDIHIVELLNDLEYFAD